MSVRLVTLFFAGALILAALHSSGQERNLYFKSFKVTDGMPDNSVVAITQDTTGYIWIVSRYGLSRYDGVNFKNFKHEDGNSGSISSDEALNDVAVDRRGRLWVTSKVLELYHPETETFEKFPTGLGTIKTIFFDHQNRIYLGGPGGLRYFEPGDLQTSKTIELFKDKSITVNTMYEDGQQNLWVGTSKGLYKINFGVQHQPYWQKVAGPSQLNDGDVTTIVQKDRDIWIGTRANGIFRYTPQLNNFEVITKDLTSNTGPISDHVRKIMIAKNGSLWIGTQDGLSIYNSKTRKFYNFQRDPTDPHSLSQNSIHEIFQDKAGSVWIGTYFGGMNVVHTEGTPFTVFQNNAYKNSLSSNIISTITEDAHHNLWIGTEAAGLNFWNKQTGLFSAFKNKINDKSSLSSNLIKAIVIDREGDIYVGTANGGLNVFHPTTGKFENYWYASQKSSPVVNGDDVKCMLVSSRNEVLVGTSTGLKIFSKTQHNFITPDTNTSHHIWITALFEDKGHTIWAGTADGLYRMTPSGQMKRVDFSDPLNNNHPLNFDINCIQQDQSGRIWVGTHHHGLVLLDLAKHTYKLFTISDGLAGNDVVGLLGDRYNNLWISTDNGLSKLDISHNRFQNLTIEDGLPDNQFNKGSYYKQNDSTFYFGTYNGLISFNPARIVQNKIPPKVVFSFIKLFNQPLKIEQQQDMLKGDLNYARSLTFTHDQNVFTIGFAALNFIKPTKNRYAYRLVGFDRDWNYVELPTATYTNLPPGDYQLLVKAANNDGLWNPQPTVLNIHILPAPWRTWWAYLIYLIIAGIIAAYIRRFLRARLQLRQELFRERIEKEQEKKNYQQQLDFFTDVSHEIRTPLTLILGPAERLAAIKMNNGGNAQQYISSIQNNANRLYKLVTELLDFRKAGANQLKLYLTEDDLIKFLKDIYYAFQSAAEIKHIDFQFDADSASLMAYFDRDQLEKVFNNLFINAVKFTPPGGRINVSVHEDATNNKVEIVVEDNGKGIEQKDIEHIFDNFYQADFSVGSGIGLALSKRLVELHKGTIAVKSKPAADGVEGFTAFTVTLNLGRSHLSNEQVVLRDATPQNNTTYVDSANAEGEFIADVATPQTPAGSNRTILLVEDNDEVREFIKQSLENNYQVIEASNGQEGFNYAIRLIPDLIISDVMMPVMDGLELCTRIKADIRTCHIPVIMLTAKSAPVHHIDGLQHGADAYITKPFSTQILHLNIHNMLALIAAQQQKHSEHLSLDPLPVRQSGSEDEKLLQKLQEIVHLHMANPDLDLTMLTREAGMSKSVLYKKFSALTNQSLNNFIKAERLKKAVKLFKDGETSVIAVAVMVGFNDVKYFSREFKKCYNVTPNEYLSGDIVPQKGPE